MQFAVQFAIRMSIRMTRDERVTWFAIDPDGEWGSTGPSEWPSADLGPSLIIRGKATLIGAY